MENQAHPSSTSGTDTPAANPAGAPAPASATPAAAPVASPPVSASPAAPTSASAPGTVPSRKLLAAEDDSIPDDADTFEISKNALKKRLERATKSSLKASFGTDNVEEILAWKAQNEEFRKREEEQRLAEMTEAERFKTQFEKAQAESAEWKTKYEQLQESYAIREQDRQMSAIAAKHVNPEATELVMMKFAAHLQGVDPADIGDASAYADKWIKDYIAANPIFGVAAAAPAAPAAAAPAAANPAASATPAVRTMPITNGAAPMGRPQNAVPSGALAQKTLAPGQPNSMTDAEARTWMRQNGIQY